MQFLSNISKPLSTYSWRIWHTYKKGLKMIGDNMDFCLKKRASTQTVALLPPKKKINQTSFSWQRCKKEGKKPPKPCEEEWEGPVAFSCPWLSGWQGEAPIAAGAPPKFPSAHFPQQPCSHPAVWEQMDLLLLQLNNLVNQQPIQSLGTYLLVVFKGLLKKKNK